MDVDRILLLVKKAGGLLMILCAVLTTWVYCKEMVATIGGFAIGDIVLLIPLTIIVGFLAARLFAGHAAKLEDFSS